MERWSRGATGVRLADRVHETLGDWLALGHEIWTTGQARLVRRYSAPRTYDANFAYGVRAETAAEIDAFLSDLDVAFSHCAHRMVVGDRLLAPACEARLLVAGFELQVPEIALLLEGPLRGGSQRGVELRPVQTESDWASLEALHLEDHREEARKGFHETWEPSLTHEIVSAKRAKAPRVQYFLARCEGVDCGFFSAWPGRNGIGKVEDLFTLPEFRGRGIGRALIVGCVEDARARGAGPVAITARSDDTPVRMYLDLGFQPVCLHRVYLQSESRAASSKRGSD